MATRKKPRRQEVQLAFEALSIVGGLLSPDWLSRVAQVAAGNQVEADYGIPKGLNLRDEIGRFWRIAQAHWAELTAGRAATGTDPRALSERFVLALLRDCLGFASLAALDPVTIAERTYPIGFSALGRRVPVVIAPLASELDTPVPAFGEDGRRRSAFGLVQEYLNAADESQWGIACDGITLRIARDNASLTRPAWIEADLARVFTEERYADFAALWLLAHETRFGRADQPVEESALETWRKAGLEEGTRIRGKLEQAFEDAVRSLGQGFLAHPNNQKIRAALQDGSLSTKDYFNQLLRLVYRLIFLLTVEERGFLHPDATPDAAKQLYADGYSMKRLRERCLKRSAHDRNGDLWEAMKIVFRGLAVGEPRLGLPALAGIFAITQCPALDGARLENHALLGAVFRLSWLREPSGLTRVNWRDMGPEELGSVYETLLELVPQVAKDGRQFTFAEAAEAKGNARKTSGSYYTPDSLVQLLLDSALEPVIADTIAKHPENTVEALLGLSIVDPACGSGHFLLGAARRLASHVARLQVAGTPSIQEYQHALRQVVGRCVFGVDANPMAVELCKVSLWMEAVEPGLPLTFLDSHIQQGNSLLGTTPELMDKGIPDAAWDPIEGDDKKTASALKKRNKVERTDTNTSFEFSAVAEGGTIAITSQVQALDAASDQQLGDLERKQTTWQALPASQQYRARQLAADAWCAAFVWPKPKVLDELTTLAPTHQAWKRLRHDPQTASPLLVAKVQELAREYGFFHWHLAFPQVFAKGGFDLVLGNPPWDSLIFREQEFFAEFRPEIARAATAAARKRLVAMLENDAPALFAAYRANLRRIDGTNGFVRSGGRYPLCGTGRVNLFALFAEAGRALVSKRGRLGQILPSGIVSDDSTKLFFQSVVEERQLVSFFDFENRDAIFNDVHRSFKFGIFTIAGSRAPNTEAEFIFFATRVEHLKDPERRFALSADDIALLNPATKTCPIFRGSRDAALTTEIYRKVPVLAASGWNLTLRRLLNSADDSANFVQAPDDGCLPLYQSKYFHQYEHRWATSDQDSDRAMTESERKNPHHYAQTGFYYPADDAVARFGAVWKHSWVIAWRRIARSTDERTFIATALPSIAVPHTARVILAPENSVRAMAALLSNLNCFAFDYIARQKVGGTDVSSFIVEQLALLGPDIFESAATWDRRTSRREWLLSRVLELIYTAWDLEPFARDVGYAGPPFRWDAERRFVLRAELDAALFHLYGLSRDNVEYVMGTFPITRRNDERTNDGKYRTRDTILEIHDEMAVAAVTGKPYQTRLDPAPGTQEASHAMFSPDGTPRDYAEALRTGLLFTLVRRIGDVGVSTSSLSRALLWIQDSQHATSWMDASLFSNFERIRESDPLIAKDASLSQVTKLLDALENEKAIIRDTKGVVRLRADASIPNWLPQTPTLNKFASVMLDALERAEKGAASSSAIETRAGGAKPP